MAGFWRRPLLADNRFSTAGYRQLVFDTRATIPGQIGRATDLAELVVAS
ncbi:hypothetical protein [Streptomyces fulvoviolaceus]|nr:hypothetical protein [Streptomyces fulvoviolaceus]MCT9078474.1 hypothetical protein [Streptomyces fulvoviolaceus]